MSRMATITVDEPDPHEEVLKEALAIWRERQGQYHDLWRDHGARGNLVKLRWKLDRVWRSVWHGHNPKNVDDALDAINYAVCVIRCVREENLDGRWDW